ncbi:MAG: D-amino acid aminotransferase [Gammaproteobacteria bacterium]|nr:D-amino acid aminotransferase [Gammaproteobacteria bacterium]
MPNKIVYLNGDYLPVEQASVSVLDRGFLFGDGVYEVIPVFGLKPLRVDEHLQRLQSSLSRISLDNPLSNQEWKQVFDQLLERNPGEDRAIYLQITRGVYPVRDLKIQPDKQPTIFMMVLQIGSIDMSQLEQGIETVTINDFRWHACDVKSISLVANVMLREQATQAGVVDAILVRDGYVTEGTASNFFMVKKGVLITPPIGQYLLSGITRDLVIDLAKENGIDCEIRPVAETELESADEIWLTSSTREIAPVVRLNGKDVADAEAGPLWKKMINIYQQYKQVLRQAK